jgi:hypothetical protein
VQRLLSSERRTSQEGPPQAARIAILEAEASAEWSLEAEKEVGEQVRCRGKGAALRALDEGDNPEFMRTKIMTASFFGDHILARVAGLRGAVLHGGDVVARMPVEAF